MNISQNGLFLIKQFESFSSRPYTCPAGKLTIGFGHVILPGESFTEITLDTALELLRADCAIAENTINKAVKPILNQNKFDALTSFTFNVGCENFLESTLLKLINLQDYQSAANQFPRWIYANGVALDGLINRRNLERELFLKAN